MPEDENEGAINAEENERVLGEDDEDIEFLRAHGVPDEEIPGFKPADESAPLSTEEEKKPEDAPAPEVNKGEEIDIEALKKAAQFGESWQRAFANDPAAAVLQIMGSQAFTPEMRAAVIANMGGKPPEKPFEFNAQGYEPETDFERALMPNLDWIRDGGKQVSQALALRDQDIRVTYAHTQALNAKLDALFDYLGIEAPAFNPLEVLEAFGKSADKSLDDIVSEKYGAGVKEKVKLAKQAKETPRPNSLRNASGGNATANKPKSMLEAYQRAGELLGVD